MRMTYYRDTDTLSIELLPGTSVVTEPISENLTVDRDATGRILTIDIEHAGSYLDREAPDAAGRFTVQGQRIPA